jgi:cytochrome c6
MKALFISLQFYLFISMFAAPVFAGDPFAGSNIYVLHCVSCHGGDGRGEIAGTPSFREGRLMSRSTSELMNTVKSGRNLMPAFRGVLDEQQIDDVITYIRTFN